MQKQALGIVRKIDHLGRIVIPMEVRRINGLTPGTPMEMFAVDGGVVIKKYAAAEEKIEVVSALKVVLEQENGMNKAVIEKAIAFIEGR